MSKQEDLDKIDELVRTKMISLLEQEDFGALKELNVPVTYLAKNNVVSEKAKSTVEEDIQQRLKEAEERRRKNESK